MTREKSVVMMTGPERLNKPSRFHYKILTTWRISVSIHQIISELVTLLGTVVRIDLACQIRHQNN